MSLVANHLESVGVTTVIIGSARDIVEETGAARFVFTDQPLGNPCGRPWDPDGQRAVVSLALDLAAAAIAPRTTVQAITTWPDDGWRDRFMDVSDRAALEAAGIARRAARTTNSVPAKSVPGTG